MIDFEMTLGLSRHPEFIETMPPPKGCFMLTSNVKSLILKEPDGHRHSSLWCVIGVAKDVGKMAGELKDVPKEFQVRFWSLPSECRGLTDIIMCSSFRVDREGYRGAR